MPTRFQAHLEKFITLSPEEFSEVQKYGRVLKVKKKENLLVEGQICKQHYFVLQGCLRKFFIKDSGVEQTTEFAIDNW
ncbi:MAG: hypothetical protein ACO1OQ_09470 [Rufibacter sp.]